MRKFISVLLVSSMLFSITTSFAENELKEVQAYDTIEVSEYAKDIELVEAEEVVSNAAIDTSGFTEDNVLYQAMQNKRQTKSARLKRFSAKNAAVQNTEIASTDEVTADFDIVMNFDMSSDMYDFDVNGDKEWLEDFKAIAEQAPNNTRYTVLSSDTEGFTYDLEASIDDVERDNYTGESDVVAMLDDSAAAFDDDSDNRNKVVIATTRTVEDAVELEDKLDELRNDDIIPFVFVLNEEKDDALDIDGVYQCATDLELRLAVSDLYYSFGEFSSAYELMTTSNVEWLQSDLRSDYHPYTFNSGAFGSNSTSFALSLTTLLNMYKLLPLTTDSYDLIEEGSFNVLEKILKGNLKGITTNDFNTVSDNMDRMFSFWESKKSIFITNYTVSYNSGTNILSNISSNSNEIIEKNLKRRFPLLYISNSGTAIITKASKQPNGSYLVDMHDYGDEIGSTGCLFDFYDYLIRIIDSNGNKFSYSFEKNEDGMPKLIIGSDYKVNTEIKIKDDISVSNKLFNGDQTSFDVENDQKYIIGVKTKYTAGLPDSYNTSKLIHVSIYSNDNDMEPGRWYYDYVYKATLEGIVTGYTDDGERTFKPLNNISRAEFLVMVLKTAGITIGTDFADATKSLTADQQTSLSTVVGGLSESDVVALKMAEWQSGTLTYLNGINLNDINTLLGTGENKFWGANYMNYALANGLINEREYLGLDCIDDEGHITENVYGVDRYFGASMKINREEAAYIMWTVFLGQTETVNMPSNIYEFPEDVQTPAAVFWRNGTAFKDMTDISPSNKKTIRQLYLNNIMVGYPENDGSYFRPKNMITRAEMCTVMVKTLFDISSDLEEVLVSIDGMGREIEFGKKYNKIK